MSHFDDSPKMCFYCKADPVLVIENPITSRSDQTWEELIRDGIRDDRGQITVRGYACAEHEDALSDAFIETFGSAHGTNLRPPSTCPDPYHTGGEGETMPMVDIGGGWGAEWYRCPTCGEGTGGVEEMVDPSDPAYQFALKAITRPGEPSERR